MRKSAPVELRLLSQVDKSAIIELMNNPLVRRQMPLLTGIFNETACEEFVSSKELLWSEHGFGPWAFFIDRCFAGWGGLQPEDDDLELAIVLHPKFWGTGKLLFRMIIKMAFDEMRKSSVTVLFPPSRTRIKGLLRLGFKEDGEKIIGDYTFLRYRLIAYQYKL